MDYMVHVHNNFASMGSEMIVAYNIFYGIKNNIVVEPMCGNNKICII